MAQLQLTPEQQAHKDLVEYNHQKEDGWYLVGNPDLSLNGLMVRYHA
ncbi:hypothetical protein [Lacticaseibacillus suibinensis]|nr:hypothetical protein [Lacticaseibacillus suibinensis]